MALTLSTLVNQVQTPSDAPRIFIYSSADAIADINTAGYFNGASKILRKFDILFIYSSTGGTPALSIAYVNDNTNGVVDITDGTTITSTDTD